MGIRRSYSGEHQNMKGQTSPILPFPDPPPQSTLFMGIIIVLVVLLAVVAVRAVGAVIHRRKHSGRIGEEFEFSCLTLEVSSPRGISPASSVGNTSRT